MNKATDLYEAFGKAISTRDGVKVHTKNCVEVFVKEMEKIISEFDIHSIEWWAYRLQEIREDLEEL